MSLYLNNASQCLRNKSESGGGHPGLSTDGLILLRFIREIGYMLSGTISMSMVATGFYPLGIVLYRTVVLGLFALRF